MTSWILNRQGSTQPSAYHPATIGTEAYSDGITITSRGGICIVTLTLTDNLPDRLKELKACSVEQRPERGWLGVAVRRPRGGEVGDNAGRRMEMIATGI